MSVISVFEMVIEETIGNNKFRYGYASTQYDIITNKMLLRRMFGISAARFLGRTPMNNRIITLGVIDNSATGELLNIGRQYQSPVGDIYRAMKMDDERLAVMRDGMPHFVVVKNSQRIVLMSTTEFSKLKAVRNKH